MLLYIYIYTHTHNSQEFRWTRCLATGNLQLGFEQNFGPQNLEILQDSPKNSRRYVPKFKRRKNGLKIYPKQPTVSWFWTRQIWGWTSFKNSQIKLQELQNCCFEQSRRNPSFDFRFQELLQGQCFFPFATRTQEDSFGFLQENYDNNSKTLGTNRFFFTQNTNNEQRKLTTNRKLNWMNSNFGMNSSDKK